jgi:hypothetical protein
MVDALYNGSFSNVKVTDNSITGELLLVAGISMDPGIYAGGCGLSGPVTMSNNTFSGNISFPVAVNPWRQDGLTQHTLR